MRHSCRCRTAVGSRTDKVLAFDRSIYRLNVSDRYIKCKSGHLRCDVRHAVTSELEYGLGHLAVPSKAPCGPNARSSTTRCNGERRWRPCSTAADHRWTTSAMPTRTRCVPPSTTVSRRLRPARSAGRRSCAISPTSSATSSASSPGGSSRAPRSRRWPTSTARSGSTCSRCAETVRWNHLVESYVVGDGVPRKAPRRQRTVEDDD